MLFSEYPYESFFSHAIAGSAVAWTLMGVSAAFPAAARAADEGQADLDKATELKLGAQTSADLTDVIRLCDTP